jgi:hypothetical protein
LVYLANAFRPQGFSPSRRFDPTGAVWLCFAPLPPIGFRPSELFPPNQPRRLSTLVALLPLSQRRPSRVAPFGPLPPPLSSSPIRFRSRRNSHLSTRATPGHVVVISHVTYRRTSELSDERPTPALKRRRRTLRQASTGSVSDQRSTTRTGVDPDSRALLRLSSRSLPGTVRHPEKPMLSWPSSPPRFTRSAVGLAPSPLALFLPARILLPKKQARFRMATPQGISSRTWERLRRAPPTSLRFPTSSACLPIPSVPLTHQRPGECVVEFIPKDELPRLSLSLAVMLPATEAANNLFHQQQNNRCRCRTAGPSH